MAGGVGIDARLWFAFLGLVWFIVGLLLSALRPKSNTNWLTFVRMMLGIGWVLIGLATLGVLAAEWHVWNYPPRG